MTLIVIVALVAAFIIGANVLGIVLLVKAFRDG